MVSGALDQNASTTDGAATADPSRPLAVTDSEVQPLLLGAGVLAPAGAALIVAARRRKGADQG